MKVGARCFVEWILQASSHVEISFFGTLLVLKHLPYPND
jgi:hypothetical protein